MLIMMMMILLPPNETSFTCKYTYSLVIIKFKHGDARQGRVVSKLCRLRILENEWLNKNATAVRNPIPRTRTAVYCVTLCRTQLWRDKYLNLKVTSPNRTSR